MKIRVSLKHNQKKPAEIPCLISEADALVPPYSQHTVIYMDTPSILIHPYYYLDKMLRPSRWRTDSCAEMLLHSLKNDKNKEYMHKNLT